MCHQSGVGGVIRPSIGTPQAQGNIPPSVCSGSAPQLPKINQATNAIRVAAMVDKLQMETSKARKDSRMICSTPVISQTENKAKSC